MTTPSLTPSTIGLPSKFTTYREHQLSTILSLHSPSTRFDLMQAPTGFGKSATSMSLALMLSPLRLAYLVGTKGLQRQLDADFNSIGLHKIMGKGNYPCQDLIDNEASGQCDEGKCNIGHKCEYREGGCDHYDAQRAARDSPYFQTNLSYWMSMCRYSDIQAALGKVDVLVCDEAHTIEKWLGGFCAIKLSKKDLSWACGTGNMPRGCKDVSTMVVWAKTAYNTVRDKYYQVQQRIGDNRSRLLRITNLSLELLHVSNISDPHRWVIENNQFAFVLSPIWPTKYAERYVFQHTPQVVLSTAWLPPGHIRRLGIDKDELTIHDIPSSFPVRHRPFYFVPTKRYNYKTFLPNNVAATASWARRIDQFVDPRIEHTKGINHTSSYERARLYCTHSKYRDSGLLFMNTSSDDLAETLERFRRAKRGVLVTPSVFEGYDFKDDEARWQVISTVIYPNLKDPLTAARKDDDKSYLQETAAHTILQIAGRIVRSKQDWGETAIFDEGFKMIWRYLKLHAPASFKASMIWRDTLPRPLNVNTTMPLPIPSFVPVSEVASVASIVSPPQQLVFKRIDWRKQ